MNHIDSELYRAVVNDRTDILKNMDGRLMFSDQLTPAKNTVLHLACQYGSIKCVKQILSVDESLLFKINSRGETALHVAARQGQYHVVVALVNTAKSFILQPDYLQNTSLTVVQNLIRISDEQFETALHVAVRYNHNKVVELLVKEDPSHEYPQNKHNETPLYMACTRCYAPIVRTLLDSCESPTFGGPDGKTALHAAVLDDDRYECVKLLLGKYKALVKVADNQGWTAFHYVACNNFHSLVVEALVAADRSVGYLVEKEYKRTALHIAAYKGNVGVIRILTEHYPDSWEIVDSNGSNILHIAVEQDQEHVIGYVLSQSSVETYNSLLIQRDNEGNTPLHLMAKKGSYAQQLMDIRAMDSADLKIDWGILNENNLTPLEVLHCTQETGIIADQAVTEKTHIEVNSIHSQDMSPTIHSQDMSSTIHSQDMSPKSQEPDVESGHWKGFSKTNEEKLEEYNKQYSTHMIVAALITTVALTAGFAMPGGFDDAGTAILLRKTAFKTFIVADTIALLLSMSSLFLYFVKALMDDARTVRKFVLASAWLNVLSILAMMLAFTTGTYAALAPSSSLAISVCVISSLFFLLLPVLAYFVFVFLVGIISKVLFYVSFS